MHKRGNTFAAKFDEERKNDLDYQKKMHRRIETTNPIDKQFKEHVESGNFIKSVMRKVSNEQIKDKMLQAQRKHSSKGPTRPLRKHSKEAP